MTKPNDNLSPQEQAQWDAALAPIHPGEILDEEFLQPANMSRNALAIAIGVPAPRINDICTGKRGITADTALRLGTYFNVSPEMWLRMQAAYDLQVARPKVSEDLTRIKPRPLAHA